MKLGNYTDPLVLAVVFNDFDSVKKTLESGNYNSEVLKDIGDSLFGIPIPVYYISRCWEICLGHEFSESFYPIAKKNYEKAKKILTLFKENLRIASVEIPFSKIIPACWALEDENEEDILDGKHTDFIAKGRREIDLDLYIAVQKMDFLKAKALLKKGANPHYQHDENDTDLLGLCGGECSYQATCMIGDIIKVPTLWNNSIGYDEIGGLLRWAANEQMYQILESYIPKNQK